MIRVAIGSAKVLGLTNIRMNALPTTAHFMTPGRCTIDCKFCTQAKSSAADEKLLSRISWPEYKEEEVFFALHQKQDNFKRVCLQVVHSDDKNTYLEYVKKIKAACDLPVSVDLKAKDIGMVRTTFKAGADVVGLPIDCANPQVFSEIKEGSYKSQIELIQKAAYEFPGKLSTHLIVGLGESEKDAVDVIQMMHEHDVTLGLFAFTPVKGTLLEKMNRPTLGHYRRIQLARFLIYNNFTPEIKFDEKGRITSYGLGYEDLLTAVEASAFQTTGCPGCNRPFYNETPKGVMYNYPYIPSKKECDSALNEALGSLGG